MKKLSTIFGLYILSILSVFAWDPHADKSLVGATSEWSKGLWFTANQNAQLTVNLQKANGDVKFGYYKFDENTKMSDKTYLNFVDNTASFNVASGDMIGYFMEVDGQSYYSTRANNGESLTGFYFTGEGVKNASRTFSFYDSSKVAQLKMTFNVSPSGQPLPGVMASLLIIGTIFGGMRFFFKKNK